MTASVSQRSHIPMRSHNICLRLLQSRLTSTHLAIIAEQVVPHQMKSIVRLEAPSDRNFQVVKGSGSGLAAPLLAALSGGSASQMHSSPK